MNTAKLRSKRVVLPTITAVAVLAGGATAWSAAASDDVRGSQRDRVAGAATQAVGGTVIEVETSDDPGEAYEVEVRKDDGTEVDVSLDKDLTVVSQDAEGRDDDNESDRDDRDDRTDTAETDDRALSATEATSAAKAALNAVDGGTVIEVEASGDRGEAYEVEVRDADNTEWDVELDADFKVLSKTNDK